MTKSDFRATRSLAADLMRFEESIKRNQKGLDLSFSNINTMLSGLENLTNPIEFRDSVSALTSSIRENIDSLDDDMTGLDGLDLFEFKNSPDDIVINLENCVKLIVKAKGNHNFQDEIQTAIKDVQSSAQAIGTSVTGISSSLKLLLDEIGHFKGHSKDLLQNKIL